MEELERGEEEDAIMGRDRRRRKRLQEEIEVKEERCVGKRRKEGERKRGSV